jgi:hypothetical protein
MAKQTIQNSTCQVSFTTSSSSRVVTSFTTNTTTTATETTPHADHNNNNNNSSNSNTNTNGDQTNKTSGSILRQHQQHNQQQQQQPQIRLPDVIQDKSFASRTATITNGTTVLDTIASSTSTCKVAGSRLPAQFSNSSHHIVPMWNNCLISNTLP